MKYYCIHCQEYFEGFIVGHAGYNLCCAGGCNTSDKEIFEMNGINRTRNEYKLIEELLKFSKSKIWDEAKKEWKLDKVYFDSNGSCLCGHFPIKELCIIENSKTKIKKIVGNCCVKKFNTESNLVFQGLKRIVSVENSINIDALYYVFKKGIINLWEHDFYRNIMFKRKFSAKQQQVKERINRKINLNT